MFVSEPGREGPFGKVINRKQRVKILLARDAKQEGESFVSVCMADKLKMLISRTQVFIRKQSV